MKQIASRLRSLAAAVLAIAATLTYTSCNSDSDSKQTYMAWATLRPTSTATATGSNYYLQLDSTNILLPNTTAWKATPYGSKTLRALVNFTFSEVQGKTATQRYIDIISMDTIRTKATVPHLEGDSADIKTYGNDKMEITNALGEDGYLTLFVKAPYNASAKKTHYLNLVTGVDKDNAYTVDLRHNAQGDTIGSYAIFTVAFDLSQLPTTTEKTPKLKLNYRNLEGKSKSVDIPFYFHNTIIK